LARNLEKPVMSLYGTQWRELGFRLSKLTRNKKTEKERELMTGEGRGGGRGAESYDHKKARSSINHSIIFVAQ
jgi:hypothetical protein